MADGDFFGIGGGLLGNGGAGINPAQMGLLQGGLALMQSRPGEGFGGALGRAGQAGLQGYSAGLKQDEDRELKELRKDYLTAQTKGLELTQDKQMRLNKLLGDAFGGTGAVSGIPQAPQAPQAAQSGWVQPQQGDSGPAMNGALAFPVQQQGLLGGAMGGQPAPAPQQPPQGLLAGGMGGQPPAGLLAGMGGQQNPNIQTRPPMPQQMPQQQAPQPGMPQGQPGQMPASGFPFSLPQVMAIQAAGGPDLLPAYKYATDGVKRDAGAFYDNPITRQREYIPKLGEGMTLQGGQVSSLPGYMASNAAIQGAQAGAVAAGQEAARAPYVGKNEAATQAARLPYRQAELQTQAALDPMQVVGPNGDMVYANRLGVAQGGMPGGQGGMPGGMRAAINPVSQDAAKTINSDWITNSYRPTLESGKTAGDLSNSLQAFRGVDLNTGWGTEAKAQAASILGALGVKDAEKYAGEAQKFQSVAMDRLLNSLKDQKGPQTEGDSTRASKTFATLGNTPQANAFIADMAQAQANQQQRKAQFYEAALPLAQRDGDLTRVDREWRKVQGSIWADPILAQYPRGR